MPRARRSAGYRSAAAARTSSTVPLDPPTMTKPRRTSGADSRPDPAAATMQPATPRAQPVASTGTRRCLSIARPAGSAATADDARNTAGPRPRIDSMPVTRTSVMVETATTSWSMPLRHVSVAASRTVFRRTSAGDGASEITQRSRRPPRHKDHDRADQAEHEAGARQREDHEESADGDPAVSGPDHLPLLLLPGSERHRGEWSHTG